MTQVSCPSRGSPANKAVFFLPTLSSKELSLTVLSLVFCYVQGQRRQDRSESVNEILQSAAHICSLLLFVALFFLSPWFASLVSTSKINQDSILEFRRVLQEMSFPHLLSGMLFSVGLEVWTWCVGGEQACGVSPAPVTLCTFRRHADSLCEIQHLTRMTPAQPVLSLTRNALCNRAQETKPSLVLCYFCVQFLACHRVLREQLDFEKGSEMSRGGFRPF